MAITGWGDKTADEMRAVVQEHGITSFKVFMAYKGAIMVDDGELYQVMKHAAKLGAVVTVHAENGDAVWHLQKELVAKGDTGPEFHPVSRPSSVEGEATGRALMMARMHGTTAYIVHMTCREAVEALVRAKLEGQRCYGETCPAVPAARRHGVHQARLRGSAYVMSPADPPRAPGPSRCAVARDSRTGCSTRWAPITARSPTEQKLAGRDDFTKIPNGAAGIEDRLQLLYTYGVCEGRFDLQRMVALGSTSPAKIFGLYPRKGTVAVGADADLVVYDPSAAGTRSAKTHHSQVRPQHLRRLQGARQADPRDRQREGALRRRQARCRARRGPVRRAQAVTRRCAFGRAAGGGAGVAFAGRAAFELRPIRRPAFP